MAVWYFPKAVDNSVNKDLKKPGKSRLPQKSRFFQEPHAKRKSLQNHELNESPQSQEGNRKIFSGVWAKMCIRHNPLPSAQKRKLRDQNATCPPSGGMKNGSKAR
ncbi:MAG: hypothetical protein LBQ75_08400 [Zoogloeaceae bacterium]|nr:hypothetical protein [Zoogloeaceae bacterium]